MNGDDLRRSIKMTFDIKRKSPESDEENNGTQMHQSDTGEELVVPSMFKKRIVKTKPMKARQAWS